MILVEIQFTLIRILRRCKLNTVKHACHQSFYRDGKVIIDGKAQEEIHCAFYRDGKVTIDGRTID